MRSREFINEYYDPQNDKLGVEHFDDTRRPKLTLRHLHDLRKAKDVERIEKETHLNELPDIYNQPEDASGEMQGGF